MRKKRHVSVVLASAALAASILACNAPAPTPQAPPPTSALETPSVVPLQETPPSSPTQVTPEATPTNAPPTITPSATETALPTEPSTPSTARPTPAPPVSTGPLDFPEPARLDDWRPLPNGRYEATIILRITGGAPPYTIHHDTDVFTTDQMAPPIVFEAIGCSALVHTIVVESADGQSARHDYWIRPPWCE